MMPCHTNLAGDSWRDQIHKRAPLLTQQRWRTPHRRHLWSELSLWPSLSVEPATGLKSQDIVSQNAAAKYITHEKSLLRKWQMNVHVESLAEARVTYRGLSCLLGLKKTQALFPAGPALQYRMCTDFPSVWPVQGGRYLLRHSHKFDGNIMCVMLTCNKQKHKHKHMALKRTTSYLMQFSQQVPSWGLWLDWCRFSWAPEDQ